MIDLKHVVLAFEVLQQIEWSGGLLEDRCPVCFAWKEGVYPDRGHKQDCKLDRALEAIR